MLSSLKGGPLSCPHYIPMCRAELGAEVGRGKVRCEIQRVSEAAGVFIIKQAWSWLCVPPVVCFGVW